MDPRRGRGRTPVTDAPGAGGMVGRSVIARIRAAFGRANRPLTPGVGRMLNVALLAFVIVTSLAWARANFLVYDEPGNLMDPFTDATTYLAAGERLNAGHDLYRLQPGDRPVLTIPGLYSAPLLSPPPIAVLWRPLAAIDWGYALWVGACWVVLLGTVVYVVLRGGLRGVLLVFLLSHAIGEQLAVANVNAFMPALYILVWRLRRSPASGALIGVAAAIKLAPLAMVGWLAGTRRWRAVLGAVIATLVMFLIGGVGAGFGSYTEYLRTLPGNTATALSLSGQTGIPLMSYAFLAGTSLAALLLGPRRPKASFVIALLGAVLGTPALYASGLVSLLALMAPFIGPTTGLVLPLLRRDPVSALTAPSAGPRV